MCVFVAAADESDGPQQSGPFVYGGFVGPAHDWTGWFTPAWRERVLNGAPALAHFHMAQIRNPKWQAANGLTATDAERRIDEAVRVVSSMGSIHVVRTSFDGGHFRQVFKDTRVIKTRPQPGTYKFQPDYVGFLGFARGALEYVNQSCQRAARVDFVIERKQGISHRLPEYYDALVDWLKTQKQFALLDLLGGLTAGDKTDVPLQAADLAMWHIRRREAGEAAATDIRRLRQMFDGRTMTLTGMTNDEISGIGARSAARAVASPFTRRPPI